MMCQDIGSFVRHPDSLPNRFILTRISHRQDALASNSK